MAELTYPHSAVAELRPAMAAASVEGVVALGELPAREQADLRGPADDDAFRSAVQGVLGIDLPLTPNTVAARDGLEALWLGPDQWLLVADGEAVAAPLADALAGRHAAVTDVSAARVILELDGPKAGEVLAKGCSLDLHPRAFAPGRCAQTLVARAAVLIQQTDQAPTYRLYVRPSYANYLASWLMDAMREYAVPQQQRVSGYRPAISSPNGSG